MLKKNSWFLQFNFSKIRVARQSQTFWIIKKNWYTQLLLLECGFIFHIVHFAPHYKVFNKRNVHQFQRSWNFCNKHQCKHSHSHIWASRERKNVYIDTRCDDFKILKNWRSFPLLNTFYKGGFLLCYLTFVVTTRASHNTTRTE